MRADGFRGLIRSQRQQLVAQRQQTTWLKANDGNAARGERRIGRDQSIEFDASMIDETRREEGSPATQGTAIVQRLRDMHAVSAGDQHLECGLEIFALVSAVEGISKQNDFMPIRSSEH